MQDNWTLVDTDYGVGTAVAIPFGSNNDCIVLNFGEHEDAKRLAALAVKSPKMKTLLEECFVHLSKLDTANKDASNEKLLSDIVDVLQEISV